jgi:hypothetical protein
MNQRGQKCPLSFMLKTVRLKYDYLYEENNQTILHITI